VPEQESKLPPSAERMIREVETKQGRIERARGRKNSVLSSIAILGVVGWSVAVPTLIGVAVGLWIDHRWPSHFSWTLTLLTGGLVFGCVGAWMRVKGDQP